ncbi:MAG: hypothetical protein C0592_11225, partial [Marinilabiliales bacterium]
MTGILLEITTRCVHCGDAIAINSAVNKFWCPGCKGLTRFPNELWTMLLDEISNTAGEMSRGEARSTSIDDANTGTVRISFRKTDLHCPECKEPIAFHEGEKLTCDACGTHVFTRKVPASMGKKGFNYFINEDPYQVEEEKDDTYTRHPAEISCTNCGASIEADGSKRLVNCQHCDTDMMLPDGIWYRLNPSEKIRPWYFAWRAQMDKKPDNLEFEDIYDICCDDDKILYCIGENTDGSPALWAMTADCQLKWMNLIPADKRWPDGFAHILNFGTNK